VKLPFWQIQKCCHHKTSIVFSFSDFLFSLKLTVVMLFLLEFFHKFKPIRKGLTGFRLKSQTLKIDRLWLLAFLKTWKYWFELKSKPLLALASHPCEQHYFGWFKKFHWSVKLLHFATKIGILLSFATKLPDLIAFCDKSYLFHFVSQICYVLKPK